MRSFYSIFVTLFLIGNLLKAQTPAWHWATQAGGNTQELATAIASDSSGNGYITGYFTSNATFGDESLVSYGSEDIFVAKLDPYGNYLWAKHAGSTLGSSTMERGRAIAVDGEGNAYVTGTILTDAYFDNDTLDSYGTFDMFVAKYNTSGELLWAKNGGGIGHDHGKAVAVDQDGNCYVTGTFQYDAYFDNYTLHSDWGGQEVFFAKYDTNGNLIWVKKFAGPFNPYTTAICVDDANNVFIAGGFASSVILDSSHTFGQVPGIDNIFIVKAGTNGTILWANMIHGVSPQYAQALDTDAGGALYVAGHFAGETYFGTDTLTANFPIYNNADIFVAKYSADGVYQWVRQLDPTIGTGYSIAVGDSDRFCIAGMFTDSLVIGGDTFISHGAEDIFISGFNNDGQYLWTKQVGSSGTKEKATGIADDHHGNFLVTGSIRGIVDFDSAGTINTGGGDKIFVAQLGSGVTGIRNTETIRPSVYLFRNYPNPFNPSTTIRFVLPLRMSVELTIYNLQGQRISRLVTGIVEAGEHAAHWDASGVAGGTYFARLSAAGFSKTLKIVLIK